MKTVIIQGSSRVDGNTSAMVQILQNSLQSDRIDLISYDIQHYDYQYRNANDDFLTLMNTIVTYDLVIFATPVYWYAMSGIMKAFFDRITDCLRTEKDTGRKLRGKSMAAISCGSEGVLNEGFFVPFESSAEYLGMSYHGDIHTWVADTIPSPEVVKRVEDFAKLLKERANFSS